MGIGTNTLGYGHPEVDDAVRQVVDLGNMSTLNCPEEVHLIERLIALHPWAQMGRLCRTGGEANAVAIRIARAASRKDTVLVCGYHGWHDWYLAANIESNSELDDHLLPGLAANGVPKGLKGTIQPFAYNDLGSLEEKIAGNDIAAIKMEVCRSHPPKQGYLSAVRKLATDNNIILIFDECTSGFRETFGGLNKKYGVDPDMMILGKTLGNGYAITAILGQAQVMKSAEGTFISSTFWTERIGPAAALKTLEVMEREQSWEKITKIGKSINVGWQSLAERHALPVEVYGLPALTSFLIPSDDWLKYKTFITQEMLKQGFLGSNSVYCCTSHSDTIIAEYLEILDPIFGVISECERGRNIDELLEGPVCHDRFKRLN
jgi:glutamate-1-semialdehyde 2,1-aminomutase